MLVISTPFIEAAVNSRSKSEVLLIHGLVYLYIIGLIVMSFASATSHAVCVTMRLVTLSENTCCLLLGAIRKPVDTRACI